MGLQTADDAAVYRVADDRAIIQTVDFFPPVVDDPYAYGAIAAANAMSDVYAMGGEVVLALNLGAFPKDLDREIVREIFRGGADKVAEAGAVIGGGHTILDDEPKYGLAVTGFVHPDRIIRKSTARAGDLLVLTKPLGTGIVTTALKHSAAASHEVEAAVESMMRLNHTGSRIMQEEGVHAATDVTGYSLLGHSYEMADASGVGILIRADDIPLLAGTLEHAAGGHIPGGLRRNRRWLAQEDRLRLPDGISEEWVLALHSPETSGGLLISLEPEKAPSLRDRFSKEGEETWVVGEVTDGRAVGVRQSPAQAP